LGDGKRTPEGSPRVEGRVSSGNFGRWRLRDKQFKGGNLNTGVEQSIARRGQKGAKKTGVQEGQGVATNPYWGDKRAARQRG